MKKRTANEIENDFKKIRTVVETTRVTSLRAIAKEVHLTLSEVRTSLEKHPRIMKKILEQLSTNKEDKYQEKYNKVLGFNQNEPPKIVPMEKQHETKYEKGFVVDASITGIEDLENILSNLCVDNSKIVLTSVTIKELEKMQKFHDICGMNARHILAMAAENPNSFHTVLIDESLETPDDSIVAYCAENKNKVTLLTSDKTMVLKARMYGVQTQYFKYKKLIDPITNHPYEHPKTLLAVRNIEGRLVIPEFYNENRSILLISDGVEYSDGVHEVKIGDDVYIATKKPNYMTFAHYRLITLDTQNNSRLIYSARIYNKSEILDLPNANYKSFMRDFKRKHTLHVVSSVT